MPQHITLIRSGTGFNVHQSGTAGRVAFHRHCFRNLTQTSITFHTGFDFEKMVCCLMSIVLSIIKSVRRQIGRRTLEFLISKKRGESLHWELSSEKLHYGYRKTYGLEKERGQQMPKQKLYTFILCGSAQMSSFFALKESSIYFCQSNMHKWKKGGVSKSLRPILESFLLVVSRDAQ